ncbi:MAG: VanW family protein [bacterium]|nr:VanW family protein [bacterium]
MSKHAPKIKNNHLIIILGSCLLIVVCIGIGGSALALESHYATRIAPGVFVGPINASNLTKSELHALLTRYQSTLEQKGIQVQYKNHSVLINPTPISLDPDIPLDAKPPIVSIRIQDTVDAAFAVGHSPTGLTNIVQLAIGLLRSTTLHPLFTLDQEGLKNSIHTDFEAYEQPTTSPHFAYQNNTLTTIPGKSGREFNIVKATQDITQSIELLQIPSITLSMNEALPVVTVAKFQSLSPQATILLATSPTSFTFNNKNYPLDRELLVSWITPSTDGLTVSYDPTAIRDYLTQTLNPRISIKSQSPRFTIEKGIMRAVSEPITGKEIDVDATIAAFTASIASTEKSIPLVIKEMLYSLATEAESPQVTEIIATGETNFKGSPQNRKKNIAIGMSRIDGLLVMPDEEFSLIKALGPIDAENGFLPELVIKGDKTKPDFGGGLCQVSTTLFRAIAYAGLPILERRNHSYRVSYYEPPVGFDATIYFPKPDFRFKNDTGEPILILASVKGTIANVTLWGTKDGRKIEIDKPTVFNIVKAPAVKYVETTTLKPGEKKCTERAHNGADAIFERRIITASGEEKKDIFKSHYVVWPAVCLIGKAAPIELPVESTSTPPALLTTLSTSTQSQ